MGHVGVREGIGLGLVKIYCIHLGVSQRIDKMNIKKEKIRNIIKLKIKNE